MIKKIKSIRGMKDYLPSKTKKICFIEQTIIKILKEYSYKEIKLPIVEHTSLFKRAIGNVTDIIQKEMYTFLDKHGNNVTLRPEGTAGCVRSVIKHGLIHNKKQKLWYYGPMFRYERPQKGRYRQFYQIGVETFGYDDVFIELELIIILLKIWKKLKINKYVTLEINSIGSSQDRSKYSEKLFDFLKKNKNFLDKKLKKKINKNCLKILDNNSKSIKKIKNVPLLKKYLNVFSKKKFKYLCELLEKFSIKYKINPYLMRGLDYYNDIVFEWVTKKTNKNKQTICAGGRYDTLTKILGGSNTPAIGFAIGIERLMLLTKHISNKKKCFTDVYLISIKKNDRTITFKISEKIRNEIPWIKIITNLNSSKLKKKLSLAIKKKSYIALIFGEKETKKNQVIMKYLNKRIQKKVFINKIIKKLKKIFKQK
ncbi:histidine--tRNA ligase [Buchnera aphidicola (Taiwanaphis decaspermi)]|uniref:histidine--tRNA ligase n=1 Tax=Buchnera aphidicola TaxID=9 RepID=UPI0031B89F27